MTRPTVPVAVAVAAAATAALSLAGCNVPAAAPQTVPTAATQAAAPQTPSVPATTEAAPQAPATTEAAPQAPATTEATPNTPAAAEAAPQAPAPAAPVPAPADPGTWSAIAAAAALPVRTVDAHGYVRTKFGDGWKDPDGNGCDTRNDVLARDLTTVARASDGCKVVSGILADPYTGATITFTRGKSSSSAVQIDHVVALSNAWASGADTWTDAARTAFANDPLELLAVDGPANMAKSDSSADEWLPPNTSARCAYTARQVAVKQRYGLTVTAPERQTLLTVLQTCPNTSAPTAATGLLQ